MAPLLPPLPDEIGANPVFGRACLVQLGSAIAQQRLEVGVDAQHRVRPQPGCDDAGVSETQIVAFGQQAEIPLDRLPDALVNRDWRRLLRLRGDRIIYNDR